MSELSKKDQYRRFILVEELALALEGHGVNETIPHRPIEQIRSDLSALGVSLEDQAAALEESEKAVERAIYTMMENRRKDSGK